MEEIKAYVTIGLIIVTCIVSIMAWSNPTITEKYIFNVFFVLNRKQWYRLITSGFLHSNYIHLGFNMYALYLFGRGIELNLAAYYGDVLGRVFFLLFYIIIIAGASVWPLIKHKDHDAYSALGASGGVSGVVFAAVLFYPTMPLGLMFIPVYMPGFFLATLYLIYSYWSAKAGKDNIGHEAHLSGALLGLVLMIVLIPESLDFFIAGLKNWDGKLFRLPW